MSNEDDKRRSDGFRFDNDKINDKISDLWSSELKRSHSILEGVMALLSPGAQQELSAILEILAVDGDSQIASCSVASATACNRGLQAKCP
ncbi:MAG: hypothetical protein ABIO50_04265 [Nitrosospira sp.]